MKYNEIINGDAIDVMKNLDADSIHALITDPPYNYEFIGQNWNEDEINRRIQRVKNSKTMVKNIPYGSGLAGGVRNAKWYKKNRENIVQYQDWCTQWGKAAFRVLKPGALALVFNSTRTAAHVQIALEDAGFYARDIIVWRRNSGIPKGLNAESKLKSRGYADYSKWEGWYSALRTEWEAIVVVQKPLENNYTNTLMKYNTGLFHAEREDTSGFQSDIIENIRREKKDAFNNHPTVKPVALMEQLIKLVVPKHSNNILLDPFIGSGTTAVAAQNLGVKWLGIEINPAYVNIANMRLKTKEAKQLNLELSHVLNKN